MHPWQLRAVAGTPGFVFSRTCNIFPPSVFLRALTGCAGGSSCRICFTRGCFRELWQVVEVPPTGFFYPGHVFKSSDRWWWQLLQDSLFQGFVFKSSGGGGGTSCRICYFSGFVFESSGGGGGISCRICYYPGFVFDSSGIAL